VAEVVEAAEAIRPCRPSRRDCSRSSKRRACPGSRPRERTATRRGRRSHRSPAQAALAGQRGPVGRAIPAARPGPETRSGPPGRHRPSHPEAQQGQTVPRGRQDLRDREIRADQPDRPARVRSRSRASRRNDSAPRCRRHAGSRPLSGRRRSDPAHRSLHPRPPRRSRGRSPRLSRCQACVRARILLSSLTRPW
jgi:hypothetical protein